MLSAMGDPNGEGKGGFVLLDENFKACQISQKPKICICNVIMHQGRIAESLYKLGCLYFSAYSMHDRLFLRFIASFNHT